MPRRDDVYESYLRRASAAHDVPMEILRKILDIEGEKQFMKRRHNIHQSLRSVIIEAVRGSK